MNDSEALPDESHGEQSTRTYKRRSSVFQVTHRVEDVNATTNGSDDSEEKNENIKDEELFDLLAYIESLQNERKTWKATLNTRKTRRRNLQKQKSIVQKQGANYDLSLLSESDRSFLLARPPYEHICKNLSIISDVAMKVATLNREIQNLNDRLTLKMEEKLVDTTKRIIEMSKEVEKF